MDSVFLYGLWHISLGGWSKEACLASLIWLKPFFCPASATVRSTVLRLLSLFWLLRFPSLSYTHLRSFHLQQCFYYSPSYFIHLRFYSCSYLLLFPSLIMPFLACHQAHPHFKYSLNPKSSFLHPFVLMITFYSLSSSGLIPLFRSLPALSQYVVELLEKKKNTRNNLRSNYPLKHMSWHSSRHWPYLRNMFHLTCQFQLKVIIKSR